MGHPPFHIVHILPWLVRGGTERQVAELSVRLHDVGYRVTVIAGEDGPWGTYLREHGIPMQVLAGHAQAGLHYRHIRRTSVLCLWQLTCLLRDLKPDIVSSFLYPATIWSTLAAWLAGVPVIISNSRDLGFWRAKTPLPRWLERLAHRATTRFIANSHAVAESMVGAQHIPPTRINMIYNGIDLPETPNPAHYRNVWEVGDSTVVVGQLANFMPYKNQALLVRAAAQIIQQEPDVFFVLAGQTRDYGREVVAEITALDLESHFWLGSVTDSADLIAALDIGVLCSETEGLSNALLEYMAGSKPVVATHVGGNPEAVIEGKTGYLVEFNDVDALAGSLLALIREPTLRLQMGQAGRSRIEQFFSWKIVQPQWEELFRSLLAEKGRYG